MDKISVTVIILHIMYPTKSFYKGIYIIGRCRQTTLLHLAELYPPFDFSKESMIIHQTQKYAMDTYNLWFINLKTIQNMSFSVIKFTSVHVFTHNHLKNLV